MDDEAINPQTPLDLARLQNGSGLYSQATNFLSHVRTGVDARTGQFTLALTLPIGEANALTGPSVSPNLVFSSPASARDNGFGRGWALALSALDFNTRTLRLSSGDQYSLDSENSDYTDGGELKFFDKKLDSFRVIALDNQGLRFRVEYKSGETEILEYESNSGIAVLTTVRSHEGRQVFLEWLPSNHGVYFLSTVRDETRDLLRITADYAVGEITVTANPDSDESSTFVLLIANSQLSSVILRDDAQSRWDFLYDEHDSLLFPSDVRSPLGSHDRIVYATGLSGHLLPRGAPLASLPRITSWSHDPGQQQPEFSATYQWINTNNFYGYGSRLPIDWRDGTDNLYQLGEAYDYGVVETQWDETGTELSTTLRTWNRFHLQTEETVSCQGCIVRTLTTYDEDPSIPWADQKPWCQLPIEVTTEYEDSTQSPVTRRTERVETRYDETGNILFQRAKTGVIEEREYYPATGGEGCPADPYLFSRWLKQYTVTPAPVEHGSDDQAPTLATIYRYELLPSLLADAKAHIVTQQEQTVQLTASGQELIGRTTQTYIRDGGAHHGRPLLSVTTLNNLATTTLYNYALETNQLTVQTTVTGFENTPQNSVTQNDVHSILTGLTTLEQNENGVQAQYEHDSLGRVTRKTIAPGTLYKAITTSRFQLSGALHDSSVLVEETDVNGGRQRLYLDGDGRVISTEVEDIDNLPGTFREVSRTRYNDRGQVKESTTLDWVPGQSLPISLTTQYDYNGWGIQTASHRPDGVTEYSYSDPVSLQTRTWLEGSDGKVSALTVSISNVAGSPIRTEHYDLKNQLLRTLEDQRDGLDRVIARRLIEPNVEKPTVTLTRYDVHDRITDTELPDGTLVSWTYAAHSDGDHPESITLTPLGGKPIIVGQQTFDGAGRQRSLNIFGRHSSFQYVVGLIAPVAQTTARGHVLQYLYEPLLDNELIGTRVNGEIANYDYDPLHGQMIRATGQLGEQVTTYSKSGRPVSQSWHVDGEEHTTSSRYTLNGRPLGTTDIAGTQQTLEYDNLGRLAVLQSGTVTVTIEYDGLSRAYRTSTVDSEHTRSLSQTLSYDEFGREITRTFSTVNDEGVRVVRQEMTYTAKDQLATQAWSDGEQLLSNEAYDYDVRGRLVQYTASGTKAPTDPYGNVLQRQTFTLNALDGNEKVVTEYADGQRDEAIFIYNPQDPTQLAQVTHTHPSWPKSLELEYDAHGNVLKDGRGRELVWDAEDRLVKVIDGVRACDYHYTPLGLMAERILDGETQRHFYQGDRLANKQDANGLVTYVGNANSVFAQSRLSNAVRAASHTNGDAQFASVDVLLLGCDAQGSVRLEVDEFSRTLNYTAHGATHTDLPKSGIGFAGEVIDTFTGWYMPGGYRPYDPVLMCFLSPDSESPFGRGGINGYAYCGGDPVNNIDPDGHGWLSWVIAGVGMTLAIAGTVASMGTAAPAIAALFSLGMASLTAGGALAIASAGLGVVSLATGVAAMTLEATGGDQKAASILGWVSMGTGIASTVTALGPSVARSGAKWADRFVGRGAKSINSTGKAKSPKTLFQTKPGEHDVVLHDNLLGSGNAAYETHGDMLGNLMSKTGKYTNATIVAIQDIAPALESIGYPLGKPVTLVACWGGRSGAAQQVANVIRRPVQAYHHTVISYDPLFMQSVRTMRSGFTNEIHSVRSNPFIRALNRARGKPSKKLARMTTYYPQ